jgi:hypothetical protein
MVGMLWRRRARALLAGLSVAGVVAAAGLVVTLSGLPPVAPAAAMGMATSDGVAQTEEAARAEAAASGQPVEVLAFRGQRRDVTANPDGSMTARQYAAPVRVVKDGEWVEPDATLEPVPGGGFAPAAATVGLVFSGGGGGPLVRLDKNGRGISLGWGGSLPEPVVEGATATYPEVLPGVDLVVRALVDGFSHMLVVKSREAAESPALQSIDMPLAADGVEVRETVSGGVEVVDAAGGGVMVATDTPMMWDSTTDAGGLSVQVERGSRRAEVDVSVDADSVTLTPDPEVLAGPGTTYPVFIDPVYRDEFRSAWAMVDSGYPNEEYWKFDGSSHEGLGLCPVSSGACNNSQVKRLFYRMTGIAFYEGKEILSAEFVAVLRDQWSSSSNPSHNARLFLMDSGFTTTTNWNNQPSGTHIATADPPAPSSDCSGLTDGGTEWNVKPELQAAADAGTGPLTFGLRNASEGDSTKWMRFCNNAHLRVQYNTPPSQPDMDDLSMSPGAGCSYDLTGDSYINQLPRLEAYLFDPDHGKTNEWNGGGTVSEQLRAQFRLVWGANDANTWTSSLSSAKASGSRFTLNLDTASGVPSLPENTPIGWIVRAYDGHNYSSWSWAGAPTRCRFVVDPTAPDPPVITSADFPDDGSWVDMLGEYGIFEFSSPSSDVVEYRYDFTNDEAGPQMVAAAGDGTASVVFMPVRSGPHVVTVEAFDLASNSSVDSYSFAVTARPATGAWTLADAVGSAEAADADGDYPATAASGVTFGADGPGANTAVELDGTSDAYLQTDARSLANTGEGFAAAAWVQVSDVSRDQVAVSVDGLGEPGFTLGFDAAEQAWSFAIPDYDMQAFTHWQVTGGGGGLEVGEWAHLAAVYDPGDEEMRLFVNGAEVATGERGSLWRGTGRVQIGRGYDAGHYGDNWDGRLAEVRVFDRVLFADEIMELYNLAPLRQGYWQLNDADAGASPEYLGGQPLTLSGGATIYQQVDPFFDPPPLGGDGHLELDGVDGYASTAGPVVDTAESFSVTARVRLSSAQPGRSMAVLSISGINTPMFTVRYSAALDAWELVLATSDSAGAATVSISSYEDPLASGRGQLLAVVYSAFTDEVILYVDGVASTPVSLSDPWSASGALQVGRSELDGDYLAGSVDEVRGYAGVLDAATVQRLVVLDEQPEL